MQKMALVPTPEIQPEYDRKAELTAFDETKTGVKGLVDTGITEVPRIFHLPSPATQNSVDRPSPSDKTLPTIDLQGITQDPARRNEAIEEVREALSSWGFCQIVNHGVPIRILEEMLAGVRRFHEQEAEAKKGWYRRDADGSHRVMYYSTFDLYTGLVTNWRDSFYCTMAPNPPQPPELPAPCGLISRPLLIPSLDFLDWPLLKILVFSTYILVNRDLFGANIALTLIIHDVS